jgi:predicted ArsR family transcriptional regulator
MKPTAAYLQSKCLKALEAGPRSADQVASMINESILSIRPRMTELVAAGKIVDSGDRRKNASGRNAKVWRLA